MRKAIRFPFALGASLRSFDQERDHAAYVDQLMRQLLLTRPGERIHRANFGSGIAALLFMPTSRGTAGLVKSLVWRAVDRYLDDYVIIERVAVDGEPGTIRIEVIYRLRADGSERVFREEITQ
ncbi:MAG: GPW/gp25 family protein [Myxococcales bacterium]|nr:GPW/gp25 family protein [Myxococcales bacterium]